MAAATAAEVTYLELAMEDTRRCREAAHAAGNSRAEDAFYGLSAYLWHRHRNHFHA